MQTELQTCLTTNTLLKEELPVMTTQTQQSKINKNKTAENERDAQLMCGVADGTSNKRRLNCAKSCHTYNRPPIDLLSKPTAAADDQGDCRSRVVNAITQKLAAYNINIEIADVSVPKQNTVNPP